MRKFKIYYQSMTAYYNLGYVYAESKEKALAEARKNPNNRQMFTELERTGIEAVDVTNKEANRWD